MLSLIWGGALGGVALKTIWPHLPRWAGAPLYLALGWAAVFFLPEFARTGGAAIVVLIIAGGLLYTLGGLVYATKWPDPSPRYFGFHEVFHALTIGAFLCHYFAVVFAVIRV
jgi:hemolysin III